MGLDHTFSLLKFLKNPQNNLKVIHIAGTNGKGSTAVTIYSILKSQGYKVGLYTSPHLISFNERIRVNGATITDNEIISFMKNVKPAINQIKSTFFEVTTAMAFDHFKNKSVDVAVIETGLGGRLDSTNVVKPELTVITSISLDHCDLLGDTIEKIATEKAGIIKYQTPLITVKQDSGVLEIFKKKVDKKGSLMHICPHPKNINLNIDGVSFTLNGNKFRTSLIGEHQAQNTALAITAVKKYDPKISNKIIKLGLENVIWPGRLQKVSDKIYYDVAHNHEGIESVINNLKEIFPNYKLYGLLCLKGDKEIDKIADCIRSKFTTLFVSTSKDGLLLETNKLSKELYRMKIPNLPFKDLKTCIAKFKSNRMSTDILLIFGSHYIANEIFSEFEISFDSGLI